MWNVNFYICPHHMRMQWLELNATVCLRIRPHWHFARTQQTNINHSLLWIEFDCCPGAQRRGRIEYNVFLLGDIKWHTPAELITFTLTRNKREIFHFVDRARRCCALCSQCMPDSFIFKAISSELSRLKLITIWIEGTYLHVFVLHS